MDFISGILKATNVDYTTNGAKSLASSGSFLLDYFSKSGALRGNVDDAVRYFIGAYSEDKEFALKALFYTRDVRGGQGERDIFRACLRYVALNYPNDIAHLVEHIPEYGRWDDMYILIGTKLEDTAFEIMRKQFFSDLKSDNPSLLAKWLKSVNTSSKVSRNLGRYTAKKFKMNEPKYRKSLAKIRKRLDVVEKKMSSKNWKKITYSHVPSQAIYKHKTAFYRHDGSRFDEFLNKVEHGEESIKTETLYPYQIVQKVMNGYPHAEDVRFYDNLWNNLPNFMSEDSKAIAVVDTSGSMTRGGSPSANPIDISLSLGIYFAERNVGPFKNAFITFSRNPKLQKVVGNNIFEKTQNLKRTYWGLNTDLVAVFKTILDTAVKNNLNDEDIPNKIYIISDMQFDSAVGGSEKTNFEVIDKMYLKAGYTRPDLVFWNVNAYSDIPVEKDEHGAYLVSGASPSILRYAMNCESVTPYQLMLEVLDSSRYAIIHL